MSFVFLCLFSLRKYCDFPLLSFFLSWEGICFVLFSLCWRQSTGLQMSNQIVMPEKPLELPMLQGIGRVSPELVLNGTCHVPAILLGIRSVN